MKFEIGILDFMILGGCAFNLLMIKENSSKENNTLIGRRIQMLLFLVSLVGR